MTPIPSFRRYLSPSFTRALHELVADSTGQWWVDVLVHPDLKLAVRADAIDVYHRGASIFRIQQGQDGRVVPRTHFKYLMRRRQSYAVIAADGKTFDYDPGERSWAVYEKGKTLDEMVAASKRYAGAEKSGLHPLIMHPSVIDVEIAFQNATENEIMLPHDGDVGPEPEDGLGEGAASASIKGAKARQDRLDAATLEDRNGELWIVFHEAKHFENPELRAGLSSPPPVSEQIARYRRLIATFAPNIEASYREVCDGLRELQNMRAKADISGEAQRLDPLIQRAADGESLHVDGEPRLIVFGFDDDQKRGQNWTHHRQRLVDAQLTVYAVGKPDKKGAAAAFAQRAR